MRNKINRSAYMRYKLLVSLCLASLSCFIAIAQETNEYTIKINPDHEYQVMHSFGASDAWRCQFIGKYWPEEKKEQIARWLFSKKFDSKGNPEGIGLSLWRFYIGAGSMEQGDSSGIFNFWRRAECFQNPDGTYDWNKHKGQQWFLEAAERYEVDYSLAFTISAPVNMTVNGKAFNEGGNASMNIKTGMMKDYSRFLTDVIEHFEKEGRPIDYISPFNEPQWNWNKGNQEGTPATNEDIFEFTSLLSHELNNRNLQTEIAFGECASINYLFNAEKNNLSRSDQIKVFFDKKSPFFIGDLPKLRQIISSHSYFTTWPVNIQLKARQKLANRIHEINPELEYWQSEFCILESNDEITGGGVRDLGMGTALYVARVIHSDITVAHASSWQWWTAITQCDYKDGLIYIDENGIPGNPNSENLKFDGDYHDSKLLWALGNYSRFVRPGMHRIEVNNLSGIPEIKQLTDLMVSGYKSDNEIVLVFVNQSEYSKIIDFAGEVLPENLRVKTYITDKNRNLEFCEEKIKNICVPPRSLMTMIIERKYINDTL